jgi:CheY-like chemotaxis protein
VTTRQRSFDALDLFRVDPQRFDIVLTDMTMPYMAGDELAATLLSIRPELPVVLCTGYSERISEARGRELGIRAFVMKPPTQNELAYTVRMALDAKSSR